MRLEQAIRQSREVLSTNNIEDAAIEAEVLLKHSLNLSRVDLYLQYTRELSSEEETRLQSLITRRLAGEPAAYITGHREFYGLDFYVDKRVLIPRPESELLVDEGITSAEKGATTFADIGTGCGAIAVSLAVNLPYVRIYATDISQEALEVGRINCRKHGVAGQVIFLQGDLLEPVPERVDIIIANLPYVCQAELTAVNTYGHEPELALAGGRDGLDEYRKLIPQVSQKLKPGGSLAIEIGQGQQSYVMSLLREFLPQGKVTVIPDLHGIPRTVILTVPV